MTQSTVDGLSSGNSIWRWRKHHQDHFQMYRIHLQVIDFTLQWLQKSRYGLNQVLVAYKDDVQDSLG